jgi:hypothetical protein
MNSFFSAKCWYFFSLSSMGDTGQEYRRLLKIETDLSNLEITADGDLVLKANLSIKSEVRSLLILKPVIAPSLIRDCPLTIVSLEVLIKLQPLQSKPLGLAITTAAFLPNS